MPLTLDGTNGITLPVPLTSANGGTGLSSVGTSGNVLTSNGTTWISSALSPIPTMNVLTTGTSQTWTIPTGVTKVRVTVVGGGGSAGEIGRAHV